MITLTKKVDYALIALTHLAREEGLASARSIATRYHLPLPLLTNVMKILAQSGLVRSERGARGGYGLAREPEEVSLYELLDAVEGPIQLVKCAGLEDGDGALEESATEETRVCELQGHCPIRLPAHSIHDRLVDFLNKITLAELVRDQARSEQVPLATAEKPDRPTMAPGKVI